MPFVINRSIDVFAPALNKFTYQAMAHDLQPTKDAEKVTCVVKVTTSGGADKGKETMIGNENRMWVSNWHKHIKDTIEKLMEDFQKFLGDNRNFVDRFVRQCTILVRVLIYEVCTQSGTRWREYLNTKDKRTCTRFILLWPRNAQAFSRRKTSQIGRFWNRRRGPALMKIAAQQKILGSLLVRLLDDPALA